MEPVRPDDYRVSDVERAAVQERLRRAVGDGQLDLAEFDQRVATAWAARTRGELTAVTRDLPEPPTAPPPLPPAPRRRVFSDDAGGTTLKVLSIIWICALAINVTVWMLVSLTSDGPVYPWFVWMGPSGAVLATLYAIGIGRPRRS
ncbi:DUF1707 domain-containing protein [Geodermatophilus sp. YIM 151500]|uniref:DUF1707 SHOCT-like domain-containing protein n=1 Tax=Geodermatophilus sp. YIM 151500 TaxID=2984531 RepID=UPI0021E40476|nr:DUF1707 domain-containing protein [Geodermatophilus sp. YIM 151500]MCV2491160.1 DUF1707 domain-containing protein [Geodermatophilus sp. YIM 151500]